MLSKEEISFTSLSRVDTIDCLEKYLEEKTQMDVTVGVKYLTEFMATALLVMIGNGSVANVELKGTKGHNSGWVIIAIGYGMAVMIPALMFGNVSGNHINPAFTLALAISGYFDWAQVPMYLVAQILGAMFGQLMVVAAYQPYFAKTDDANRILAPFSTTAAVDDGTEATRIASWINGFINEFIGSFILFFSAIAMTRNYFGAELSSYLSAQGTDITDSANIMNMLPYQAAGKGIAHLALGFLVMALVAAFGGPTGPALNPARDLGPRIVHWLLPTSVLGEHKGDSKWWYAWVPVVAPILAGIAAVALYKVVFG